MTKLTDLTSQIMSRICTYIPIADVLTIRHASRDLKQKTSDRFADLFASIKVSFCQPSLNAFVSLSQNDDIAKAIEHITFGTETLDQYYHVVESIKSGSTAEQRAQYNEWLSTEMHGRTDAVHMLREILFRLPNLKSIKVEDRPSGCNVLSSKHYHPALASKKIQRLTGIHLKWNGPYPKPSHAADTHHSIFPLESRQFVYIAVFILLRDLDIVGKHVDLDLAIGGYTDTNGNSYFSPPFDALKALPRRITAKNMRHLEIRDVDTDERPITRGLDSSLKNFLSKIAFKSVTFNRCAFRGNFLERASHRFDKLELKDCEDVMDLGIVVRQHRHTLRFIALSNVSMTTCDLCNDNQWVQLFASLCIESSIQHLEMKNMRTESLHCNNLEENEEAKSHVYAVTWDGNERIKAGAQAMVKVVERFTRMKVGVPPVLDLMEGEVAYLARY